MKNVRNTPWASDGYNLLGSAIGLLFALLAIALLLYDAGGGEERITAAPFDVAQAPASHRDGAAQARTVNRGGPAPSWRGRPARH